MLWSAFCLAFCLAFHCSSLRGEGQALGSGCGRMKPRWLNYAAVGRVHGPRSPPDSGGRQSKCHPPRQMLSGLRRSDLQRQRDPELCPCSVGGAAHRISDKPVGAAARGPSGLEVAFVLCVGACASGMITQPLRYQYAGTGFNVGLKVLDWSNFALRSLKISKKFASAARGRIKAGGAKPPRHAPRFAYVA